MERSTDEAIQQILDGMEWAGLEHDEGPFYQTKRFDRYKEVIEELLAGGNAYRCYCTKEELAQLRARADRARGEAALRRPLARSHRFAPGSRAGGALQESAGRRSGGR